MLHITPDQNQPARQGWCLAELYKTNGADRTLVWKRYLINNMAPAKVLVADSGKNVVTLGDWDVFDTVPLVIYGEHGEIVKLLTSDTHFRGMVTFDANETGLLGDLSKRALAYFGPGDTTLSIRLDRNETLMIWLQTGEVMDRDWYAFAKSAQVMTKEEREALDAFASTRPAELAMEYLQSADARLREIGADVARELSLTEAIPRLQELLQEKTPESDHTNVGVGMGAFPVDPAKAAQRALEEIAADQRQVETGTFAAHRNRRCLEMGKGARPWRADSQQRTTGIVP